MSSDEYMSGSIENVQNSKSTLGSFISRFNTAIDPNNKIKEECDKFNEKFQSEPTSQTFNTAWIEKYRPVKVDDLVLDETVHKKIKRIVSERVMPNIIITGVPGIGKTTTMLCIAKNLLGKYFKEGVLELNASDERGIKTVQESIEYFCKKKLKTDDTFSQHKLILLDEADNMTLKAQQYIYNLMDTHINSTRFAFTCNDSTKIIEAIQSRCTILKYVRLTNQQMIDRLKIICEKENVPYEIKGLDAILTIAQGDLRKAINCLQLTFNGYTNVNVENVYKLCDKPPALVLKNIFIACKAKDIRSAFKLVAELSGKGYSSSDISYSMISALKDLDIFDEKTKIKYMKEITNACLIIGKGVNTSLQLYGCIASLLTL